MSLCPSTHPPGPPRCQPDRIGLPPPGAQPHARRWALFSRRLKTISLVIRSTQGAEEVLRVHEEQLKEAQAVPATLPELEATKAALKVLWSGQCRPGGLGGSGGQQRRALD